MKGYLKVLVGQTRVALSAAAIRQVGEPQSVHPAPRSHDAVWGLVRHGERLVPLVHLGSLLGIAERPEIPPEIAVFVRGRGWTMALGVEDAEEVVRCQPAPLPEGLDLTWAGEVVREGDRVIPIVDLAVVADRLARVGVAP